MNCASSVLHLVIATATVARDSIAREHYYSNMSQEKTQEQRRNANCITTHFSCAVEAFNSPRTSPK